jgi:WhiB family redox-sensing transcriptional regulator
MDTTTSTDDRQWRDQAICAQTDAAIFFPEAGQYPHAARKVCTVCPVREVCLADAIANRDDHGVRGGLTPNERRQLTRTRDAVVRCERGWAA